MSLFVNAYPCAAINRLRFPHKMFGFFCLCNSRIFPVYNGLWKIYVPSTSKYENHNNNLIINIYKQLCLCQSPTLILNCISNAESLKTGQSFCQLTHSFWHRENLSPFKWNVSTSYTKTAITALLVCHKARLARIQLLKRG